MPRGDVVRGAVIGSRDYGVTVVLMGPRDVMKRAMPRRTLLS